ncbi:MAG: hypothetical protein DYG98_25585 [Haliscomenobacteraceae bacterium CHB4]|nr:hypothetical protein [Haliscomenobacteraceae bacterium CHB4]
MKMFMHILLPIFSGTMIYALWRGIPLIDSSGEIFPLLYARNAPDWIIYSLPDSLWCYAFLSTIFLIWKKPSISHFLWLGLAIVIALLSEVLQAFNFIHGTFDWNDLIAYTVAVTAFCLNFQRSYRSLFVHS